jgi:hypothetical protein
MSLTRIEATRWARQLFALLPEDDQPVSLMVPASPRPVILGARLRGRWSSQLAPDGSGFVRIFRVAGVYLTAQSVDGPVFKRTLRPGWSIWWFLRNTTDVLLTANLDSLRTAEKAA